MEKRTRKGISVERNEKGDGRAIKREESGGRETRRERKVRKGERERGRKTRRPYRNEYIEEEEEEENGPCAARTPGYRQGVS